MNAVLSLVITGGELKILMDSHFDFSLCLSLTRVSLLAKVNACKWNNANKNPLCLCNNIDFIDAIYML